MRRQLLLFVMALLASANLCWAQKRLVLIEEFTNTGCGPCALWSPVLDSCIYYRLGDCIAIKYHSGYPLADDEFYVNERADMQGRVDFYNVLGVPATYVNGTELGDRTFGFLSKAVDYCMAEPERYALTVGKQVEDHRLTVHAALTPHADVEANPNLRLFVAAIEEHIKADRPWHNGETELNYTMRHMLTTASGVEVAAEGMAADVRFDYDGQWDIIAEMDESQLGVVAFLQDISTHEVLATAYSGPGAEGENRLALLSLSGTPDLICQPDYYGQVIIRNDGANTITSAVLNVSVNGTVRQYPWAGRLDYLERDTIAFDGFRDYQLADSRNAVRVWMSAINGTDAESNARTTAFSNAVQARYDVQLKLYTDRKPEEITWKLYNSAGDVVREGGPYDGQARKFITINMELTRDDCYQLEFLDAGGDGITGANGNGYYQLFQRDEAGKTTRLTQGDYTGAVCDVFFSLTGTPQPKRPLVLFEEFTNTSCDPCAEFSPALDRTIYERMGDMVAVTYHFNFPSPLDPFYTTNPEDVKTRAAYYGVTGVPSLRVNGEHAGAWGYEEYLDAYIDGAATVPAKVDIDAEAALSADGELTVDVSLMPKGLTDGSGLRLFVVAVEERVEWAEAAANGEHAWNYVMRKMLPSADGQPLEADLSKVTPYDYQFKWHVTGYTDERELGIVVFVQDKASQDVLGTCYVPRPTGSPRAAKILKVLNTPDRICTPQFMSDLVVRNTGRETLTSATLNVSINGQVQRTPWTGHLDYLDIATMRTPMYTDFTLTDGTTNDVQIWLSDLNGSTDESARVDLTLTNAYKARNAVRLTILTDQRPEETTWTLFNSAGDVVCEGGPYTEPRKKVVIDLPLSLDDCYMIEFEDDGGDGITGDYGRGYYTLHEVGADGKTRLLVQNTYTEAIHDVYFSLQNAAGTQGIDAPQSDDSISQPAYDMQGRPASQSTPVRIVNHKKILTPK